MTTTETTTERAELMRDALLFAAEIWHDLHPDDAPAGGEDYYCTSGNRFLDWAELAYLKTQPPPAPPMPALPEIEKGAHVVYIALDLDGQILYIGVTSNFKARMAAHRGLAAWWEVAVEVTATEYPSRQEARQIESDAIRLLRPIWNRTTR